MQAFDDKSLWSELLGVPRFLTTEKNTANFVGFRLKRIPAKTLGTPREPRNIETNDLKRFPNDE
jgi:hypothetical protein